MGDYEEFIKTKINEIDRDSKDVIKKSDYLFEHDLLKDFLQDKYSNKKYDILYNFYTCGVELIERTKIPNAMYWILWDGKIAKNKKDIVLEEENKSIVYPDVMNSVNTVINKLSDVIYDVASKEEREILQKTFDLHMELVDADRHMKSQNLMRFYLRNEDTRRIIMKYIPDSIINFIKWSDTIGNFVLLPEGYTNTGKNNSSRDFIDNFLEKYKNDTNNQAFEKYINKNYLWDYVYDECDVRPLFDEEFSDGINKYERWADNVIKRIQRRGMFIEIMLRLSIENKDEFEKVKDTSSIGSYEEAIINIEEESTLSNEIKKLIDKFKNIKY